jgi:hypothetical protein
MVKTMTTKKLQERFKKLKIKNEEEREKKKKGWQEIDEFLKPGINDLGFVNSDRFPDETDWKISTQKNAFKVLNKRLDLIDPDLDYDYDSKNPGREKPDLEVSKQLPNEYFWPEPEEDHEQKKIYDKEVYQGLSDKEFGPKFKAYLQFNNGLISLDKEIINLMKLSRLLNAENFNRSQEERILDFRKYFESQQRIFTLREQLDKLYPKSDEKKKQIKQLYLEALKILVNDGSKAWSQELIKTSIHKSPEENNKKLREFAKELAAYDIPVDQVKPEKENNLTESNVQSRRLC